MTLSRRTAAFAALALAALATTIATAAPGAEAGGALVKGWNNVAYTGSTKPPAEALASLAGNYSTVYRWNATTKAYEVFAPNAPGFVNTITSLNKGDAIWVNVTAEGAELATTTIGVISIAASTFLPTNDLAIYEKTFNQLNPAGTDAASERYYAPVSLPQGATVTSITVAFDAGSGTTVQARLDFTPIVNGNNAAQVFKLAETLSTAGASPQTAQAFAHTVDNSVNVYFLVVDLLGGPGAKLRGISIAYTGG
ncbi:MAG: hypothetical protein HY875_07465 [Chloroflexi bacterium]|nr:hypothetical protein [Chloroflexota bacterium]